MKRDEYKITQQVDTTDYKQKYKEAIEKLKKAFTPVNGCEISGLSRSCIEEIFTELRESEDKKWRNWLIGHLKGYINQTDDKYAEVCKKAIAWLEKQVEERYTWSEEDIRNIQDIDSILFYDRRLTEDVRTRLHNFLESIKDRVQPQPKQEWNEDEIKIEKLLKWLRLSLGYNDEHLQSEVKEMIDWLKSLKPNHWKPSEE